MTQTSKDCVPGTTTDLPTLGEVGVTIHSVVGGSRGVKSTL